MMTLEEMKALFASMMDAAKAAAKAELGLRNVVLYMIGMGALFRLPNEGESEADYTEAKKAHKAGPALQDYRAARAELSTKGDPIAVKAYKMPSAAWSALPENDPRKAARVKAQDAGNSAVYRLHREHATLVAMHYRAVAAENGEGKGEKKARVTFRETFDRMAKDGAARNQKTGEIGQGDLSAMISRWRKEMDKAIADKAKADAKAE